MSGRAESWVVQRRLLAAQSTLQRVRLAQQLQDWRGSLPSAAPAGVALAIGLGAAWAMRRWSWWRMLRRLLRA